MKAIREYEAFGGREARYDCSKRMSGRGGIAGLRGRGLSGIADGDDGGSEGELTTSTGILVEAAVDGFRS